MIAENDTVSSTESDVPTNSSLLDDGARTPKPLSALLADQFGNTNRLVQFRLCKDAMLP
jgi:hypothetical protein